MLFAVNQETDGEDIIYGTYFLEDTYRINREAKSSTGMTSSKKDDDQNQRKNYIGKFNGDFDHSKFSNDDDDHNMI